MVYYFFKLKVQNQFRPETHVYPIRVVLTPSVKSKTENHCVLVYRISSEILRPDVGQNAFWTLTVKAIKLVSTIDVEIRALLETFAVWAPCANARIIHRCVLVEMASSEIRSYNVYQNVIY